MTIPRHIVNLENDAAEAIKRLLAEIPFIDELTLTQKDPVYGFDFHAFVKVGNKKHSLVIEVSNSGQPLKTRSTIAIWENWKRRKNLKESYFIIITPFMSQTSRNLCKEAGIGFLDLTGNCRLCFDQVYIERFGFEHQAEKRDLISLFKEKASRAIRRLLSDPGRNWLVQELASEAQISNALASMVKKKVVELELAIQQDGTFRLTKPEELLKQWGEAYRFNKSKEHQYYSSRPLVEIDQSLANFCRQNAIPYALTLNSGARLIGAQYVSVANRSHCYVVGNPNDIAQALQLKPVNSGGNVILLTPPDDDLLFNKITIEGIDVVSDIQLYLDFNAQSGRIQETAEVLIDSRLKKTWNELSANDSQ